MYGAVTILNVPKMTDLSHTHGKKKKTDSNAAFSLNHYVENV